MKKLLGLFLIFTLSVSMSAPVGSNENANLRLREPTCEEAYNATVENIYQMTDAAIAEWGWIPGAIETLMADEEFLIDAAKEQYKNCKRTGVAVISWN